MQKLILFSVFLLFVFITPILCFAQPTVTITPASGAPATVISIDGKGFQPQEEIEIIITLEEGEKVGLGTEKVDVIVTNNEGVFSVKSGIPVNAKPGMHKIEIRGSKGSLVETKVEVTPAKK